jgi:hypothetical protein
VYYENGPVAKIRLTTVADAESGLIGRSGALGVNVSLLGSS